MVLVTKARAAIAGILATLLLSFSCVASACEASCDLKMHAAECHGGASSVMHLGHKPDGQRVAMGHHSMICPDVQQGAPVAHLQTIARCDHHLCQALPVSLREETTSSVTPAASSDTRTLSVSPAAQRRSKCLGSRDIPPLRTTSPVSLHTTQRV